MAFRTETKRLDSATSMPAETLYDNLPKGVKSSFSAAIAKSRPSGRSYEEQPLPLKEKKSIMSALVRDGLTAEETLRYQQEQEALSLPHFNPITLVHCPVSDIVCSAKEFDNIKLFYHPDPQPMFGTGSFSFYIARPGSGLQDCIDWRKENIKITVLGFNGTWGECFWLRVPGGAHIRAHYPDPESGVECIQDCIFPNAAPQTNWPGIVFNLPHNASKNILYL